MVREKVTVVPQGAAQGVAQPPDCRCPRSSRRFSSARYGRGRAARTRCATFLAARSARRCRSEVWDAAGAAAASARQRARGRRRRTRARDAAAISRAARAARRSGAARFAAARPGARAQGHPRLGFRRPARVARRRARRPRLTGYPALVDDGDAVALTLLDTREAADAATRAGDRRACCASQLKDALRALGEGRPRLRPGGAALKTGAADRRAACRRARPPIVRSRACSATIRCRGRSARSPSRSSARAPACRRSRRAPSRCSRAIAADYHALTQRLAALPAAQRAARRRVARAARRVWSSPGSSPPRPGASWCTCRATCRRSTGGSPSTPKIRPATPSTRRPWPRCGNATGNATEALRARGPPRTRARGIPLAARGAQGFAVCPGAAHAVSGVV